MASAAQAVQINLMMHQCTELSSGIHKRRKPFVKQRPPSHKNAGSEHQQVSHQYKKSFDPKNAHKNKERCSKCGDSTHVEGFQCPAKKFQCKACHKFGHFTSLCYQKKQVPFKSKKPKAHQLQAGAMYACEDAIFGHSEENSSNDSFCLKLKVQQVQASIKKIHAPPHLITNLAYRLKQHYTRKQYLRARLDTCVEINIMPASAYRLVFKD